MWAVWTLALALPATAAASPLLTLRHDGATVAREDPYLPPASALGADAPPARAGAGAAQRSRLGASSDSSRLGARSDGSRLGASGLRAARPGGSAAGLARAAAAKRTVRGELARMLAAGAIDRAAYDARMATYLDARKLRRKLGGTRRAALGAVLANLDEIAARGDLTVSRLPALFRRSRATASGGPAGGC